MFFLVAVQGLRPDSNISFNSLSFRRYPASVTKVPSKPFVESSKALLSCSLPGRKQILSLSLLYKNGFDVGKYISFEEQINKNKAQYYDALKISSENWHDNKNNYTPFMQNFIITLYQCYCELDKRFAVENSSKINKNSRIEATVLNSVLPISKSEICKILPDVSPSTIEAGLGKMVKAQTIKIIGNERGARYVRR